jgi:hypothetical protein
MAETSQRETVEPLGATTSRARSARPDAQTSASNSPTGDLEYLAVDFQHPVRTARSSASRAAVAIATSIASKAADQTGSMTFHDQARERFHGGSQNAAAGRPGSAAA